MNYKLYRYSPIKNENTLLIAVHYVSEQSTKLCKKVIGREFPINPLTIFTHYPDEFEFLKNAVLKMGTQFEYNNGPYVNLSRPIKLIHNEFTQLRIRNPDPYRSQVGCCDFLVPDFREFKNKYLKGNPNLRVIERPEYEMIEFFDPDFDILAYVCSNDNNKF